MKGSLLVLVFFLIGCLLGIADMLPLDKLQGNLTLYILYALMLQVGISIGCSKNLKSIVS